MRAALYFFVPLLFAAALFFGRPRPSSFWMWVAAACALMHVANYGYGEVVLGHGVVSRDFVFANLLMVALPWISVAALIRLSMDSGDTDSSEASRPSGWGRQHTVAVLALIVWGAASYVGYVVGMSLGVVYE